MGWWIVGLGFAGLGGIQSPAWRNTKAPAGAASTVARRVFSILLSADLAAPLIACRSSYCSAVSHAWAGCCRHVTEDEQGCIW